MANANGPYTANATSWNGAAVPLCGQESHDPDGDEITYAWDLNTSADSDGDGDPTNDVDCTEMNPTALFPIGVSEVSLIVADGHGLMSEPAVSAVTVNLIPVEIDIRPYTEWNIIVLGSSGLLPVAFLTNQDFDARTIDPATVTQPGREFSGLVKIPRFRRRPLAWHRDVDRDGDVDLVVFIENDELILDPDDFECSLGALTYDGFVVMGTDKVCIFRPRRCHTWRP
jgi:hypothetical protein